MVKMRLSNQVLPTHLGSYIYDFHKKWPILWPPSPFIRKNEQYVYCLKTIESTDTWEISSPPQALFMWTSWMYGFKILLDKSWHCVKSVCMRSNSGSYFPAFGLDTERYGVSLRIQFECGKMRTRIITQKIQNIRTMQIT